jgi:hypothetical protein
MEQSDTIGALAKAMAAAQLEMGTGVKKDARNPHFKNRYATLAACEEVAIPVLAKHGVWLSQGVEGDGERVAVTTQLTLSSGEWQRSTIVLRAQKTDPQGAASASTYGRRYGLMAMVGLAPEDDDGEAASRAPARHTERHVPASGTDYDGETPPGEPPAGDPKMPFGKQKGTPASQLSPRDREWYAGVFSKKLKEDPTSHYADEWSTMLDALVRAEGAA